MALEEILQDLLTKSQSIGGSKGQQLRDKCNQLIQALERECNSRYRDPGPGLHFIGILLAVFAAEVVSAYWTKNKHATQNNRQFITDVDTSGSTPPKLVSCLYSSNTIAFVLSDPVQVRISEKSELISSIMCAPAMWSIECGKVILRPMSPSPKSLTKVRVSIAFLLEYAYPTDQIRIDYKICPSLVVRGNMSI